MGERKPLGLTDLVAFPRWQLWCAMVVMASVAMSRLMVVQAPAMAAVLDMMALIAAAPVFLSLLRASQAAADEKEARDALEALDPDDPEDAL